MRRARIFGTVALTAVCLTGGILLVHQMGDYRAGDAAYAEAVRLADLPVQQQTADKLLETASAVSAVPAAQAAAVSSEAETGEKPVLDLAALRKVNREVIGWIEIPGTGISYPLMQGTDNEYYLTHTWNGRRSAVGAIFVDCRCTAGLDGFNTIIYGHRMNNGTMFAPLKYYRRQSYAQAHLYIYVTNDSGTHIYQIYAAYESAVDGAAYQPDVGDSDGREAFVRDGLSRSRLSADTAPAESGHILTLSTCTGLGYAARWIVQAAEIEIV